MSELVDRRCVDELEEKVRILQAELTALREKYSTPCPKCEGKGVVNDIASGTDVSCPNPNCTNGRVMMLDAEGVKKDLEMDHDDTDYESGYDLAMNHVLKGGSQ